MYLRNVVMNQRRMLLSGEYHVDTPKCPQIRVPLPHLHHTNTPVHPQHTFCLTSSSLLSPLCAVLFSGDAPPPTGHGPPPLAEASPPVLLERQGAAPVAGSQASSSPTPPINEVEADSYDSDDACKINDYDYLQWDDHCIRPFAGRPGISYSDH